MTVNTRLFNLETVMKRALTCGINYVGTPNELRGCLNDSRNMKAMLEKQGFVVQECLEADATTTGIKAALERLVQGAVPGDVIVFHYSGHGSQLPSKIETDGFEEIICPIDLNWYDRVITDDTLRQIFNKVPHGVNTTLILDCCHSGTALDQVETFETGVREIVDAENSDGEKRYMSPPPEVIEVLKNRDLVQWSASRDVNSSALLIAGCRADQTSADAYIDGTFQGACTYALLKHMKDGVTYAELVTQMNQFMVDKRYTQRPQLDGSSTLWHKKFLSPFYAAPVEPAPEPIIVPAPAEAPEATSVAPEAGTVMAPPTKKDKITGFILAIVAAALAAFVFLN